MMKALEIAESIVLSDKRVAVCGDWHGNVAWLRSVARAITTFAPDVTTILQLGDWWMDTAESDRILAGTGISVYVTLGNHEPWNHITPLLDAHPGQAVRVSESTWLLPRPARLHIGGREVLSLGGAASVDRAWRTEGRDWWHDEAVTDMHVDLAIAGGAADIMLTHESPSDTPVLNVQSMLRTNPLGFPKAARLESAASRDRVNQVWDAVRPDLLLHGHMHIPDGGTTSDGRRVQSMGCDAQQGHVAFLELNTLELEFLTLRQIRSLNGGD